MVMNALRSGKIGSVLKYLLFSLLLLAMGGLVFTDVGGFFGNGMTSRANVATIGSQPLSIVQFDHMARRNLGRIGMSPAQAYKMGYLHEMLNGEIRARLLSERAADIGVSVTTEQVAKKLKTLLEPMMTANQKHQDVLKQILVSQGLSEQELLKNMQGEMATSYLSEAMKAGFAEASDDMLQDMAAYQKEERAVEYILFPDAEYKDVKPPEDKQLQDLYNASKETFSKPELREGQLLILKKDSLKNTITVTDDDLKAFYDKNKDEYGKPETRSFEQTLLSKPELADQVLKHLKTGKSLKEAVKTATGNTTDYLPPQAFTAKTISEQLKDSVFKAKKGDIIGPITTPLGTHILVITDVTPENTQSFETVKDSIRKALTDTKVQDAQDELSNTLDDLLASDATLEEVKKQVDVDVTSLPPVSTFGLNKDNKPALEAFKDDNEQILKTLFGLDEGGASPVFALKEGRMAALILKTVTPKTYTPFETVKETLKSQWMADQRHVENKNSLLKILKGLQAEKQDLKDAALKYKKQTQNISGLLRTAQAKPPLTPQALSTIFEAPEGELFAMDIEGGAAIARITSATLPKTVSKEDLSKVRTELLQGLQNEAYALYIEKQRKAYGVHINDHLLEQTYGKTNNSAAEDSE